MSFFGGLLKGIGKVAKAGLGVVTGGLSTAVLDAAGSLLAKKKMNDADKLIGTYQPRVNIVASAPPGLMQKQSTVMPGGAQARGYGGMRDYRATSAAAPGTGKRRKRRGKVRRQNPKNWQEDIPSRRRVKRKKSGGKRRAPASFNANAQKMKNLAAQWRAAGGRDGTGQTFFEWKRGR